ncbi:MAG: FG-GAP-like repeat-containing protein, partial [Actinomycetota bacterium]|nr:FG-GAP-like repeat-containing protein [Actinomycetota bacterium]
MPPYTAATLDSPTPQAGGQFGWSMATVGDIDGDHVNDIAVGSIGQDVGPIKHAGRAYVFSGRTRKLILTLNSPEAHADGFGNFGSSVVGLGDVNGDGVPDIAVGAFRQQVGANQNQGKVYVFSGASGDLLYTVDNPSGQANSTFGDGIIATSDLNGDGVRDFVVTATFESVGTCLDPFGADPTKLGPCPQVGAAYAFNGKDGTKLYRFENPGEATPQAYSYFGQGIANPGDVNLDGVDDPVIGASGSINGDGVVYVENGKTGRVLRTLPSPVPGAGGGFGLQVGDGVAPGDVNGDHVPDILVGAPGDLAGGLVGGLVGGRAYLLSPTDGSVIRTLNDPAPLASGSFGYVDAGAGDVNGDGTPDVLVMRHGFGGRFGANPGAAYIFDSRTGAVLSTLPGMTTDGPGSSVATPGDVNGDGYPDYFLGGSD